MIRPIDIRLNAAHPELPLAEAVTFTGSPSTVLIRGVPPNCGRWAITAVFVAATFPDGSTTTRAAVQSANGVWVATLPATARSGRTANGLRVMADGIDENGEAVTGYILGVADFAVASLDVTPAPDPGGIAYTLRYFDALPDPAKKGDVTRIDGDLKFYNGAEWLPFADLSDYYTAEQVDEAIDRVAAYYITYDAAGNPFPTYAALVNAQTVYSGGAVRVPTRNDYCVVLADEMHQGAEYRYIYAVADGETTGSWQPQFPVEGVMTVDPTVTKNSQNPVASSGIWSAIWGALSALPTGFSSLYDWCVAQLAGKASTADTTLTERGPNHDGFSAWTVTPSTYNDGTYVYDLRIEWLNDGWCVASDDPVTPGLISSFSASKGTAADTTIAWGKGVDAFEDFTATRTALPGYQLGSQDDKPLASEAEAEALRTGKQNALSAQQLANIAAVPKKANASDLRYALTTKTIDNGAVTLDDRAINAVAVSSSLASLTVNFPTATSGKARDFGLRLTVASGVTTAPELALPQGVTCENADGEAPEIGADGAATILYFTETASGVFLVKGEVLQTITQA